MRRERFERLPDGGAGDETQRAAFAIASEMRGRFGWHGADGGFSLEDAWVKASSQNTFYEISTLPARDRIVLKVTSAQPEAASAERIAATMSDLADVLERGAPQVAGLRPIGWLESPSAVATRYVEGIDLVELLSGEGLPMWASKSTMLATAESAGTALACFHESRAPSDAQELAGVRASLERLVRVLALPRGVASVLIGEADRASAFGREYGDFGPGNVRASPSEVVYLLDPPMEERFAARHRDLAYFEFEVRKNLDGQVSGDGRALSAGGLSQVVAAFVDGYASASSFDPTRREARSLIAAFQAKRAAVMARKRMRESRWRGALWAARSFVNLRREVIHLARGT